VFVRLLSRSAWLLGKRLNSVGPGGGICVDILNFKTAGNWMCERLLLNEPNATRAPASTMARTPIHD
jgi:hypothetical protein